MISDPLIHMQVDDITLGLTVLILFALMMMMMILMVMMVMMMLIILLPAFVLWCLSFVK